ncbi:MAG TPA: sulfite exporter TauE/SafE family protein [Clostridia bacterium]|nr:sulfite exporter TauE/SafE family protein [Clostridia bacterium]
MIYLGLILTGIIAGFFNSMAGGGSLLTLPLLIFMGLPPMVANGTNRLAIIVGALSGTYNFKKQGYFELKKSLIYGIPAVIGSVIGSSVAIKISDQLFNRMLGIVMLVMLVIIIFQPHKHIKKFQKENNILGAVLFFFVGIYGGVIQAGVGFLIMTVLTLVTTFKLVKINSIKILVVLIYTIPAFFIFFRSGNVDLVKGLILSIGNGTGALIGSKVQINRGDAIIKVFLIIAVLFMSLKLLGIIRL